MKKVIVLFCFFLSFSVFANQGQALIPHFISSANSSCHLHVSNISHSDVKVTVDLFDQYGNHYLSNIKTYYAFAGNSPVNQTVTLPVKETGAISILSKNSSSVGFGYIRWTSAKDQHLALIADLHCDNKTNKTQRSVSINAGLPF